MIDWCLTPTLAVFQLYRSVRGEMIDWCLTPTLTRFQLFRCEILIYWNDTTQMSIHVLDTTDEKPHSSLFRVKLTHTYTYTHTHTHTHTLCHKWTWICSTSRFFPHSWLITGFVTGETLRMLLVEQELPTLQEQPSSPLVFSGVRVSRSLIFCVVYCIVCPFVLFLLTIVSQVLRFTDSDYPFGIFKLFLLWCWKSSVPMNTIILVLKVSTYRGYNYHK